jgi:hypothetical protein
VSREHARQKKLLRKRQKRQQQLRARQQEVPLVAWRGDLVSMPKVSDTIVAFARPLIDELPDDCPGQSVDTALQFATSVWNAMLASRGNVEEAVREVMAIGKEVLPEEARSTVEFLARRKQALFAHDTRFIGAVQAYRNGGEIRVRAAYALPVG